MTKKSQLERLTQVQLIQKIIHLESELSLYRTDRENKHKKFQEQIIELRQDKAGLKGELQKLLEEREEYYQERDDLIKEYNEMVLKKNAFEKEILSRQEGRDFAELINKIETYEKEQNEFLQMIEKLKREAEIQKEQEAALIDEKGNLESIIELSQQKISELENRVYDDKELEELKLKLENREVEIKKLEKENEQNHKEKVSLLNQITELEKENLSFHEKLLKLTELRENDEKRLDKISDNLNEVFKETKQLVRMTSSLKHQLELKVLEINQIKEDKKLLETELNQLKNDYHQSELRNKELEIKIGQLDSELQMAKQSLTTLKQLEAEKLQLSDELETKIEEFIMITENYQREKETYLDDLELIQKQLIEYKEKAAKFDKEKAAWTQQITELNHELEQMKENVQKNIELEQEKNKLMEALRANELAVYKIKKEHELALLQKTNEFNTEIAMSQENLMLSKQIQEKLENQIRDMKAQAQTLEASLEEKENFIKSFIKQPLSDTQTIEEQNLQSLSDKNPEQLQIQEVPVQQQVQRQFDWFGRIKSQQSQEVIKAQQQYSYQQNPQQKNPLNRAAAMDFFTLRNKTTRHINPPNQRN